MKNAIIWLVALILGILAASSFAAEPKPRIPEQSAVKEAEAKLAEAKKAEALRKERLRAEAKADWNSKTLGEAWAIRGQSVVDATQFAGGRAVQYVAKADATIGHYGVVVPATYVATTIDALAKGSGAYADNAWNNEPEQKEVALKAGPVEVKVDVPATK